MFGVWRTFLAVCVVAQHLGRVPWIGQFAVFGFYMLSGFLMTLVLKDRYGYDDRGLARFAGNRFLRLFPMYWAVACLFLATIFFLGEERTRAVHQDIYAPTTLPQIGSNAVLIFSWTASPRLSPPTWALTVEMFYYGMIALGISRTSQRTVTWLGVSVGYFLWTALIGLPESSRYYPILAGSLPFSLGSLLYYVKDWRPAKITAGRLYGFLTGSPSFAFGLFFANYFVALRLQDSLGPSLAFELGLYASSAVAALAILAMYRNPLPFVDRTRDKWIGDFSYPVYLTHWWAGCVLFGYFGYEWPAAGTELAKWCAAAGGICFAISLTLMIAVDRPIESIRRRIRDRCRADPGIPGQQSPPSEMSAVRSIGRRTAA